MRFLNDTWAPFSKGLLLSASKISPTSGLMVVSKKADYQRKDTGGENLGANCLLYKALSCGAEVATSIGGPSRIALAAKLTAQAKAVRAAINALLWDARLGAFKDNTIPNNTLVPQDGNALAVWFGVPNTTARVASITQYLRGLWNEFGSVSPESSYGGIATFPGSMEVFAHFQSGNSTRAHELIRRQWGYMLTSPHGTNSTPCWEGFNADGTFGFGGAYMSHSHGWASGPAAALTFYTLGIRPTSSVSRAVRARLGVSDDIDYVVAPQPGGLRWCRGSLSLGESENGKCGAGTGDVRVSWKQTRDAFALNVDPRGFADSKGALVVPLVRTFETSMQQKACEVRVNGVTRWTLRGGLEAIVVRAGIPPLVVHGGDDGPSHATINEVEASSLVEPLTVRVLFC